MSDEGSPTKEIGDSLRDAGERIVESVQGFKDAAGQVVHEAVRDPQEFLERTFERIREGLSTAGSEVKERVSAATLESFSRLSDESRERVDDLILKCLDTSQSLAARLSLVSAGEAFARKLGGLEMFYVARLQSAVNPDVRVSAILAEAPGATVPGALLASIVCGTYVERGATITTTLEERLWP